MTDPRQIDPRLQDDRPPGAVQQRSPSGMWGWVVGIVVVLAVLAVIFIRPSGTPTAGVSTPPAVTGAKPPSTTGQATPPASAPANPSPQEPGKSQ